jgi:uncharacterized damage-inducible protein DinB
MSTASIRDYFIHMFDYEDWANRKVLDYLKNNESHDQVERIFSHLIADMTPWVCLLSAREVPIDLDCSPNWTLEECEANLTTSMSEIKSHIAGLSDGEFGNVVTSYASNGRQFDNTVAEILTQILSHGQHHRGQIEWIVEHETGEYLGTSYMPYVRQLRPGT